MIAVRKTARTMRATATAASLEEEGLDLGVWGRVREEMLAGKEAEAGGGGGGEGMDGKKGGWFGVEVEDGFLGFGE